MREWESGAGPLRGRRPRQQDKRRLGEEGVCVSSLHTSLADLPPGQTGPGPALPSCTRASHGHHSSRPGLNCFIPTSTRTCPNSKARLNLKKKKKNCSCPFASRFALKAKFLERVVSPCNLQDHFPLFNFSYVNVMNFHAANPPTK